MAMAYVLVGFLVLVTVYSVLNLIFKWDEDRNFDIHEYRVHTSALTVDGTTN
jgi:hypothetical protein